jgi:hypothetical protein
MLTDYLSERYSFERFTKKKRPPILNSLHAVGLRAAFSKKYQKNLFLQSINNECYFISKNN